MKKIKISKSHFQGRQFVGPNGHSRAALTIQAHWRGFMERKRYLQYRQQKWAAGVIAIQWILHMKLATAKKKLAETRQKELDNYRMRAKVWACVLCFNLILKYSSILVPFISGAKLAINVCYFRILDKYA